MVGESETEREGQIGRERESQSGKVRILIVCGAQDSTRNDMIAQPQDRTLQEF
jgi:hypothetical protein